METRSDLVDHPYIQVIDIWELDLGGNKSRKTRIINVYDNWVGDGYQWRGDKDGKRRAIEDVSWDKVIEKRTLLVGDFNAHSPYWNSLCRRRIRADQLESIIDRHKLLVNNEMTTPTRPKQTSGCSIIDLTMSTPDLGYLPVWTIDPEYATPSDHELITLDFENLNNQAKQTQICSEITGWALKEITTEQEKEAKREWGIRTENRPIVNDNSSITDLDAEAQWITDTLTEIFDQYFKQLRVCAKSKRWWSKDISESRSELKAA